MSYKHQNMITALIAYDEKESKKKYYNRFALPIYLRALQDTETDMAAGKPLRQAFVNHFTGRLLDKLLKVAGQPPSTKEEQRGWI